MVRLVCVEGLIARCGLRSFFQALGDHGSAHVACIWAFDTFEELRYADRDSRSLGQAIHALLLDGFQPPSSVPRVGPTRASGSSSS